MQAQMGDDRLLGVAVLLDRCRAALMAPDLGAQTVRKGGLTQNALRAPVPPQRPGLPPRAYTLAIDGLRRGPPGGELPSFPRPVPWYTPPGYAMRSSRAIGLPLPTLGRMCTHHRADPGFRPIGFAALYRHPRTTQPHPGHQVFPYLLRHLDITAPNQV